MSAKRTINGKEIVSDIRIGMTDGQLMEKRKVCLEKLHNIFKGLLDFNIIEQSELEVCAPVTSFETRILEYMG